MKTRILHRGNVWTEYAVSNLKTLVKVEHKYSLCMYMYVCVYVWMHVLDV